MTIEVYRLKKVISSLSENNFAQYDCSREYSEHNAMKLCNQLEYIELDVRFYLIINGQLVVYVSYNSCLCKLNQRGRQWAFLA